MIRLMIRLLITVSYCIITVSYCIISAADETIYLEEISSQFIGHKLNIVIRLDRTPLYSAYWFEEGQVLFIDLIGSNILALEPLSIDINIGGLKSARARFYAGYEPQKGKPGKVDGVVIEMLKPLKYKILTEANLLRIEFPELKEVIIEKEKKKEAEIPKEFSFTPEHKIGPSTAREWQEAIRGWRKWLEIGMENYRPLRIAMEQYELAQLKLREARRQFFPTAVIRAVDTTGRTVGDVDIFSKLYELEFEQPISYGGELRYKVEQAKINMELARLEYKRLYADFALEVKRNYYNVIMYRMNWDAINKLLAEANKLLSLGRLLYEKALITELEYKQLQSIYQQIKFLFISTQKELSLSELNLRQLLNLPQDQEIQIVNWLPFEKVNIDLEEALRLVRRKRPELQIRKLITRFNNLNEEIAKSKGRFRISLTGKIGKMAEDYATEPVIYRDSWYVGIKVSKPLGTSTIVTSLTKQTTPVGAFRLGEETETFTKALEISLVDRLSAISDEKAAHIEFLKAINEELETEETVISEVERAYANYITTLFQIENSLKRMQYQERRIKVVEGRMKVEQATINELLQAYLDYTNEKINYNRALVGYYIALASLSRACGVESYLSLVTDKPVIIAWEKFSQGPPTKVSYTPFELPKFEKVKHRDIKGKVIGVDNEYGVAVLNIGYRQGLAPKDRVIVYRDKEEYALLIPVKIEETASVCFLGEKLAEGFKGLRIGDEVGIVR